LFPVEAGVRRGEVPPVPMPFLSDIVRTKLDVSLTGRMVVNEFALLAGMDTFTGTLKVGVMSNEYGGSPPCHWIVSWSQARGNE